MRPNHLFTIFLLFTQLLMAQTAMQNPSAREGFNLDGVWDIIVDPLENGFMIIGTGKRTMVFLFAGFN